MSSALSPSFSRPGNTIPFVMSVGMSVTPLLAGVLVASVLVTVLVSVLVTGVLVVVLVAGVLVTVLTSVLVAGVAGAPFSFSSRISKEVMRHSMSTLSSRLA